MRLTCKASPKAISGRTSYLRVRLEFLRYPHLIPALFNGRGFGPPWPFTATSSWTWIGHPVSGLHYQNFALFRLGIPSAPYLEYLTSPVNVTRRTVLQKVRRRTIIVLRQFVNTGFQVLFHSPPGVLFTVPSQYYALSVTKEYSALRGGPRSFHQGSTCLDVLWILLSGPDFAYGAFTLSGWLSQSHSAILVRNVCSPNPTVHAPWFGLRPFRSPLLRASMFLSFPPAT